MKIQYFLTIKRRRQGNFVVVHTHGKLKQKSDTIKALIGLGRMYSGYYITEGLLGEALVGNSPTRNICSRHGRCSKGVNIVTEVKIALHTMIQNNDGTFPLS